MAVVAVLKITHHANSNKKTSEVHDMTCLVLQEEQSDFRAHTFAAPGYRPGKRLPGSTVTEIELHEELHWKKENGIKD